MYTGRSFEDQEASRGQGGGQDFGRLAEDNYIFEITGLENKGKTLDPYSSEDSPRYYTDVRLFLKPVAFADDPEAELLNDKDEPLNPDKRLMVFFKPERLGFGPSGASANRQIVAAALGLNIREEMNFDLPDLEGKQLIAHAFFKTKDAKYESLDGYRPLPKRSTRRRAAAAPLVEEAEKVFDTKSSDDDYDDLPF